MKYLALQFTVAPFTEEATDILCYQLGEIGFDSFSPTEDGVIAYAPHFDEENVKSLLEVFPLEDVSISYSEYEVADVNWNKTWENSWTEPFVISASGKSIVIAPETTEYIPQAEHVITLIPHQSFGTGDHPTTHLLLQDILTIDLNGKRVLDVGCGTGVLSIASYKEGAESITALDIDEWSVESTKKNALLNRIKGITLIHGDIHSEQSAQLFDVIFANIHRNILQEQMPQYAVRLTSGGLLLLSGFYEADAPYIIKEAAEQGLTHVSTTTKDGWARVIVAGR